MAAGVKAGHVEASAGKAGEVLQQTRLCIQWPPIHPY